MQISQLSAAEIARRVNLGELSAEAVIRATFERIAETESRIRAWVALDLEHALTQAREIDSKILRGEFGGGLAGVPIGVKDVINTVVLPTRMGSKLWAGHYAGNDARIVAHLKWEGGIVAGKTETAEFAVHEPGPTRNPHDLARTPGTSSSGSAAAVAVGAVPVALGTQTAGSLIRPASFCGIYAFKPTFGWLPRTGVLKTTDTLDQLGFMARYPGDLRTLFEMGRVKGRDHVLKEERLAGFERRKRWRVGLCKTHLWSHVPVYARDEFERFSVALASNGVDVVSVDLPPDFKQAHEIHGQIYNSDLSYYFKHEAACDPESLSVQLREIIRLGGLVSPDQYKTALDRQKSLVSQFETFTLDAKLDAVISLSSNGEAPTEEPIPFADPCAIYTMCGVPTIGLPVCTAPSGLPFGIQLSGRKYSDRVLLDLVDHLTDRELLQPAKLALIN